MFHKSHYCKHSNIKGWGDQKEGIKMVEQGNKELAYPMDTTKKHLYGEQLSLQTNWRQTE